MAKNRQPTWWELLDLDWEAEQILFDAKPPPPPAKCGTCHTVLYTNGTCPVCDRAPRR